MRKIIIDTDCGVDDAVALLMALNAHKNKGIVTSGGNVVLSHVLANVLSCIHVTNATDIKVYRGASTALLTSHASASFWHGEDGFGDILTKEERLKDANFDKKFSIIQPNNVGNSAVSFLIDTILNEELNSVEVITLGPITNLTLAIRLEPRLTNRIRSILIMGGSVRAKGNITCSAEFNVYADPEAATICFSELDNVTLVDWETVLNHSIESSYWLSISKDSFIGKVAADVHRKSIEGYGKFPIPDALAMAVLLNPTCVSESVDRAIDVELKEGLCRGMTLVHWRNEKPGQKCIKIVTKVDMNKFHELLEQIVKFK